LREVAGALGGDQDQGAMMRGNLITALLSLITAVLSARNQSFVARKLKPQKIL
jgi:hypothetical protein